MDVTTICHRNRACRGLWRATPIYVIVVAYGDIFSGVNDIMAVTGGFVRMTLNYTFLSQQCMTVRDYKHDGAAFLTASCAGVAEAWWNDVKTAWRASVIASAFAVFTSVKCEEYGGGFGFGEYAIPPAEQQGTRSATGLGDFLPTYVATSVKLTVESRATRPGQQGFPFAMEGDNTNGDATSTWQSLINTLATKYSEEITLGAPVATGALQPAVIHAPDLGVTPPTYQLIGGKVLNPSFRTRVHRTPGRGS